jgi:hypothetical protein
MWILDRAAVREEAVPGQALRGRRPIAAEERVGRHHPAPAPRWKLEHADGVSGRVQHCPATIVSMDPGRAAGVHLGSRKARKHPENRNRSDSGPPGERSQCSLHFDLLASGERARRALPQVAVRVQRPRRYVMHLDTTAPPNRTPIVQRSLDRAASEPEPKTLKDQDLTEEWLRVDDSPGSRQAEPPPVGVPPGDTGVAFEARRTQRQIPARTRRLEDGPAGAFITARSRSAPPREPVGDRGQEKRFATATAERPEGPHDEAPEPWAADSRILARTGGGVGGRPAPGGRGPRNVERLSGPGLRGRSPLEPHGHLDSPVPLTHPMRLG